MTPWARECRNQDSSCRWDGIGPGIRVAAAEGCLAVVDSPHSLRETGVLRTKLVHRCPRITGDAEAAVGFGPAPETTLASVGRAGNGVGVRRRHLILAAGVFGDRHRLAQAVRDVARPGAH